MYTYTRVEINTGPVARGQWFCCLASKICYPLARLACKILKPNFWAYMVYFIEYIDIRLHNKHNRIEYIEIDFVSHLISGPVKVWSGQ